jgi:Planctomycete cytochrome C
MRRPLLLACLSGLLLACGSDSSSDPDGGADAGPDAAWPLLPAGCTGTTVPPPTLACTGLYTDLVTKELAPGVEPFRPAIELWSDGAQKQRWIALPPGTAINNTNRNEWIFPVGTRLWKEFKVGGQRIETRLWTKVKVGYWVHATYAWNPSETAAVLSPGGDVPLGAGTYHIPTKDECEKCHRGRTENILGFDEVLLGLPGAEGLTLERLVATGRLAAPPAATTLAIGDDGTGLAAQSLGWLHANCGITCHNGNSTAVAYQAGMRLRLDPAELDGRPAIGFDPVRTTLGITVNAVNWNGRTRIVPGDPETSLLYQLISNRGEGNQMPPIASRIVDLQHVALVRAWITALAPGTSDAGADVPLGDPDAGAPDVPMPPPDAPAEIDAGLP